MNKQQFIEKSNINILDLFIENPKGEFQHKGKWYSSKFGCDLIDHLVDISNSALSECWDMAGEEILDKIKDISADAGDACIASQGADQSACNTANIGKYFIDSLTSQKEEVNKE